MRNVGMRVPAPALAHLLALSKSKRFFALPRRITCAGSLPDFASMFVTVSTASLTKTVLIRGGCSARLEAVLRALQRTAGVPAGRR